MIVFKADPKSGAKCAPVAVKAAPSKKASKAPKKAAPVATPKAAAKPVKQHEADVANAAMLPECVSFKVSLFLGRGAYDRSEVATLQEAGNRAAEMQAAHPDCSRQVMVHGITAAERTMIVPPALLPKPAFKVTPEIIKNAVKKVAEELAGSGIQVEFKDEAPADLSTKSPLIEQIRAAAEPASDSIADILAESPSEPVRLWGPLAAEVMPERSEPAPQAKAAAKPAKAATGDKEKAARAPAGKKAETLAAAQRGEMPAAPDFSADTHKRWRKLLDKVIELARDGDIAGLRAVEINPISSSRQALNRYRNLCVTALEVRAKAAAAKPAK